MRFSFLSFLFLSTLENYYLINRSTGLLCTKAWPVTGSMILASAISIAPGEKILIARDWIFRDQGMANLGRQMGSSERSQGEVR
jgi:hypothetical protein